MNHISNTLICPTWELMNHISNTVIFPYWELMNHISTTTTFSLLRTDETKSQPQ